MVKNAKNYDKPPFYDMMNLFGPNVVSTNGEEWRKHRSLCNLAFGDTCMSSVVKHSIEACKRLFSKWEANCAAGQDSYKIEQTASFTDFSLEVLGLAGFGYGLVAFPQNSELFC